MKNLNKETPEANFNHQLFADRISDVPRSFIREILKVAISKDIISFAGGLPNRSLFPIDALKEAAIRVFEKSGREALQYSNTEGLLSLREYISQRYQLKFGIDVAVENILITSGSQQGLDLLGKILINPGDKVIMEEPGYLGAIQAFSCYQPTFLPIRLNNDGIDIPTLTKTLNQNKPKFFYTVPCFQNPSGISYSPAIRQAVADLAAAKGLYIIEDNPYIDVRFDGSNQLSFSNWLPSQTIMLGTFSKTAVPGMRLGWVVAPDEVMDKLIIAKQAADLHSNNFIQHLLMEYLLNNNIEEHIKLICRVYGQQCNAMLKAMEDYFPRSISYTRPYGGMFLWVTMPQEVDSMKLLEIALRKNVAFVPGNPFYTDKRQHCSTMRLNFSCANEEMIKKGILRLAESFRELFE